MQNKRKAREDDWEELRAEERVIKRIKQGKATLSELESLGASKSGTKWLFRKKQH